MHISRQKSITSRSIKKTGALIVIICHVSKMIMNWLFYLIISNKISKNLYNVGVLFKMQSFARCHDSLHLLAYSFYSYSAE
jgi:hypothetical protein